MSQSPFQFVFIVGVSGSGTTMLSRLLGGVPGCVSLGGLHITIPETDRVGSALVRQFNEASARLWDRQADAATADAAGRELAELLDRLRALPPYRDASHFIYKRSFPFFSGDRHRPDLTDLFRLFADVRLVVIHRDPRAATASSLRRQFGPNLRSCALVLEDQLTYIAAQLATLGPSCYLRLGYEAFCRDPEPGLHRLAAFCGLDETALHRACAAERVAADRNDRWAQELNPEDVDFLNRFFDERRCRQWGLLSGERSPAAVYAAAP